MTDITVTKAELPPLGPFLGRIRQVWSNRWLTNDGRFVREFESAIAQNCGVRTALATCNATVALEMVLQACHLEGEVITTPFTFVATTNAILQEGLTPVFADVSRETFNLDPERVEAAISPKTSAVLAVHTYGNPCDVEGLARVCRRHRLPLIFDSAHAFGAEYRRRPLASYGDISVLSFHATKVMSSAEGGMILLPNRKYERELRLLRNHGIASETRVVRAGTNAKMTEIQAAFGLGSLENFPVVTARRGEVCEFYDHELEFPSIERPRSMADRRNFIYYPVCFKSQRVRDRVYSALKERGVLSRRYFFPLTSAHPYVLRITNEDPAKATPVAFDIARRVLCLPVYSDLTMAGRRLVVKTIRQVVSAS